MRIFHNLFLVRLTIAALMLGALVPVSAAAQDADTSYTDETHGVTIGWTEAWVPTINEATNIVTLDRDKSIIVLVTMFDSSELPPEDAVFLLLEEGDEITEDLSSNNPPRVTLTQTDTGMVYVSEAYSVNDGETTVLVIITTIPVLQSSAIDHVQAEVTVNGSPVFTGEPLGESAGAADLTGNGTAEAVEQSRRTSRTDRGTDETPEATAEATEQSRRTSRTDRGTDETPEATAEATEESGRTSRTSRSTDETPEATEAATEESTNVVTRTSRSGSGATETPEVTEVATQAPDPTAVVTAEATEGANLSQGVDTFVGAVYGYSFEYNPNIWEAANEIDADGVDGVRLNGETGTALIWGMTDYGSDPVGCLEGEHQYYGTDNESFSNWEIANDSDGNPLWYEGEELAWGVFSYTYTTASGESSEFVDYISCETIPGHDAVLIVQLTSIPEEYNANLDAVLDILDTLEFAP